jgi:hypothetical protein
LNKLDPDQLEFVEILAKLMMEREVFRDSYTDEDYAEVITWLKKLRTQIDITIDTLEEKRRAGD